MDYIAYLHKDRDSDFGVSFPDFPGCVTAGRTLEEARRLAAEALVLHIEGMKAEGEEIPEPSSLDDLRDDRDGAGALVFLIIPQSSSEKTVRINITARQSQLAEIDRLANKEGMTRSAYIVQHALQRKRPVRKTGKRRRRVPAP